jgi:MFS family permease
MRTLALGALTFLLMLPETLPVPVLRALITDRFGTPPGIAAWFMAANMIGAMLAAPLAGFLADRGRGRTRPILAALVLDAILMAGMAHANAFAPMLALRVLEGGAHITALSLVMSLCADAAGPHRGRVMGMVGAGLTLGIAIGAALGGRLGRDDPLRTLWGAALALLLAASVAALALPADVRPAARHGLRSIARAVAQQRALRVPLALSFVDRFTVGFFTTSFPLLLAGVWGVPRPEIGLLLGAFLLPFALLSYPFGRLAERTSPARLAALGSAVYGLGTMLVGVTPPHLLWGLMPLLGISSAVFFVPTLLLALESAPAIGRGTAIAAFHAAGSLGFLIGPITSGAIVAAAASEREGHALAFAVAGAAALLSAFLLLPRLRRPVRST